MSNSNTAAWLTAAKAPLSVGPAPYPTLQPDTIIVRNKAVAINPTDWAMQEMGQKIFAWMTFPCRVGCDLAGEVVEVGSEVTRFKPGDRVLGFVSGMAGADPHKAFQEYTLVYEHFASLIPDEMAFEDAAVIPLGLVSASNGLFGEQFLALEHPSIPSKPTGKSLLIWGGSTSVGCNAIQLAVAAGYEVITTSSPKNFAYIKKLGAQQAFDYASPTVVQDLIAAFKGKTMAGAYSIAGVAIPSDGSGERLAASTAACEACMEVVAKSSGAKFVSSAQPVPEKKPEGVDAKFVIGEMKDKPFVFEKFLQEALAKGIFIPAPEAVVVGSGLESVQLAMDTQKKGVSAKKVVVTL
ncbi:hypothetical protein BP5796_06173 [Coleophoma crateriformis]|uniref:Enoyl reductase (ER) domain-containing protein n=1 Tax=Coleophoma crateriformis TaxID=565419 RepID=A0A3D8RWY4_9HELO|nr:hypothetical protein BP5796_06173 [Coleophoma crateriformis]